MADDLAGLQAALTETMAAVLADKAICDNVVLAVMLKQIITTFRARCIANGVSIT